MDDLRISLLQDECKRHEEKINRLSDQIYELRCERRDDKYEAMCRRDNIIFYTAIAFWIIYTVSIYVALT